MEVTERRGTRRKQLLDDVKETRSDWNWKMKRQLALCAQKDLVEAVDRS
jgi:hypothetical protein